MISFAGLAVLLLLGSVGYALHRNLPSAWSRWPHGRGGRWRAVVVWLKKQDIDIVTSVLVCLFLPTKYWVVLAPFLVALRGYGALHRPGISKFGSHCRN